jgi:hypothetical protein
MAGGLVGYRMGNKKDESEMEDIGQCLIDCVDQQSLRPLARHSFRRDRIRFCLVSSQMIPSEGEDQLESSPRPLETQLADTGRSLLIRY